MQDFARRFQLFAFQMTFTVQSAQESNRNSMVIK